jgi:hypothetical protein
MHPQHQLDPVSAQDLAQRLAQRRRLARKHMPGALHEGDLAIETAHGLRHLDAHRPAAEDQQAARNSLHPDDLAVGPHAVQLTQARDWRHDRIRANRHDDVLRGVPDAPDVERRCRPADPYPAAARCPAPPASAAGRRRNNPTP